MDALQILRDDHRRVKDLFRQFDEAEDGSTRKAIANEAIAELMIHAQLEEEVFYPAMQREGLTEIVKHSEAEHEAAESMMEEILGLDARYSELPARFQVLSELVIEHITEEESQLFPRAAELGYERLENLGDKLQELRNQLLSQPRRTPRKRASTTKSTTSKSTSARKSNGSTSNGSKSRAPSARRLEDRTKEELYEQAAAKNIEGRSEMTKDELVEALRR
jgi:hemerythrin-like domain-containing protein